VDNTWKNIVRGVFVLAGLAPIIMVIYFALFRTLTMEYLLLVVGAELSVLLFLFGLIVLYALATDQIRIDKLISEPSGDASISRFQLLVFTFMIALSFVLLLFTSPTKGFPTIPNDVLILLGISTGTYGVGKGLQVAGKMVSDSSSQPPAGQDGSQPKPAGAQPTSGN
jgi:hypothetical protein